MKKQRPTSSIPDHDRFRILVENSLDAAATIDREGKVTYVSPSICRVLGYSNEDFVKLNAFEIVHPADRQTARSRFADLLDQSGSSQTVVNRMQHRDGSWRWIETVSTNQIDTDGVNAVIASFRDVTTRQQALNAVRDAEERLRFIVESATEFAIFTTDLAGRVNSWNSGANRILGYEDSEIVGQDCRIFFTPEDNARDQSESEMHHALLEGRGNDEKWHVRKDGSRFWGSGLMMPLRDDDGVVHGYLKIFRDMTREKKAQQELQAADRRKDEFLAVLAHELRNPLAAISNAAALLLTPVNEDAWAKGVIQRQSKHLARLLDDLLDMARITQGKIRLNREQFNLRSVIGSAVETVTRLLKEKNHQLILNISSEEIFIFGDPTRIEQVVINLLTNAIKYTDDRGRITVTLQRGADALIIVRDTGIGISRDMQEKIFELFVQVDRMNERSDSGLGIGLTLARSIVELHGGRIWVKSDGRDKGSEFGIVLPLADT